MRETIHTRCLCLLAFLARIQKAEIWGFTSNHSKQAGDKFLRSLDQNFWGDNSS